MLSYSEALKKILETVEPLPTKVLPLADLLGYVTAQIGGSKYPSPRFDNSAVDGFGVLLKDVEKATADAPTRLNMLGEMRAGSSDNISICSGAAVKILTGAIVPEGVEAVVMREYCQESDGIVSIGTPAVMNENIRKAGQEYLADHVILAEGILITPPIVGLIASLGYAEFTVHNKPRVSIVTTGDELKQPGTELENGQIWDSNSYALRAAVNALGLPDCVISHAVDSKEAVRSAFQSAIENSDIVISSGGVSVGDHDYVKEVLEGMGVKTVFWRIAIKPGKPVYFGYVEPTNAGQARKLIFGLPGNPVSSLVTFHEFVKPAILKMMGKADEPLKQTLAVADLAKRGLSKRPGRLDLVRGRWSIGTAGKLQVVPATGQESHMISGLANANCLIHFGPDEEQISEGESVQIKLLNWFD